MARIKNQNRRKRKYGDRKSITEKNQKRKQQQHERHRERLLSRTQELIGKHVRVRGKDQVKPLVGTVLEVLRKHNDNYPHGARRHHGSYLKIRTAVGERLVSRHRVKPIRD